MRSLVFIITACTLLFGGCASKTHVYTQAEIQADAVLTAPLIEAAVTHAMTDLYTRAKSGSTHDRIIFSLAIEAGRDTSGLPDPAATPANIARSEALERQWYESWRPVSETLSPADLEDWTITTRRQLYICVPCGPNRAPDGDTDASYAAWVRLNDRSYWSFALTRDDPWPRHSAQGLFCILDLAEALKLEAALKWLDKDIVTATGRRATLNRALRAELYRIHENGYGHSCLEGRFEGWRESLRANRPELDAQMAAFLEQRVGDPRDPKRRP